MLQDPCKISSNKDIEDIWLYKHKRLQTNHLFRISALLAC